MTLQEFINKYNGKAVDFDKHYGAQCVDLYRQYLKEVLELPQTPPVIGAKDIWTNHGKSLTAYPRASGAIPQAGDIVIWGKELGNTYGHVGIFVQGDKFGFTSFDQNWPEGSLCHLQGHSYNYVLGWLRDIMPDMDYEKEIRKLNTEIGRVTAERDKLRDQVKEEIKLKEDNYNKWQEQIDLYNRCMEDKERSKDREFKANQTIEKIKELVRLI